MPTCAVERPSPPPRAVEQKGDDHLHELRLGEAVKKEKGDHGGDVPLAEEKDEAVEKIGKEVLRPVARRGTVGHRTGKHKEMVKKKGKGQIPPAQKSRRQAAATEGDRRSKRPARITSNP